jgi:D-alanyl-D-alanine carboxypeptidase
MPTRKKVILPNKAVRKYKVFLLAIPLLLIIIFAFFSFRKPLVKTPVVSPVELYQHPLIPELTSKNMPSVLANNYILVDVATNKILFSKGADQKIYPASITKLATALTALNIYPLEEVISIGATYSEGKVMELRTGEKITIRSLVTSLLVYSANDAGFNLANHHRQGVPGFIKEMNGLVKQYNLRNTNFTNYDGIHSPSHYSTVYDLSQLGRLAIKNPVITDVVKHKQLLVTDIFGTINHPLVSTNELLGVAPEIEGLKTGWTPEAGGCFIALMNINGRYLISVVAQSPDRFADTQSILSWSKQHILWLPYTP